MRQVNAKEREELQALIDTVEVTKEPYEDATVALNRAVKRIRRACFAPVDAVLDDSSFEWVRFEQTPQGQQRRVLLKVEEPTP